MGASGRSPRRKFAEGDEVEVRLDGTGFRGAWYEARLLCLCPDRRRFTVVYEALADDADEFKPLHENVLIKRIRPRPPPPHYDAVADRKFQLEQAVDAWYNDGWWPGVVSMVPVEGGEERYGVRFPNAEEEEEEEFVFGLAELRPHLEWVHGEWVDPRAQDKLIKSPRQGKKRTVKIPHKFKIMTAGDDEAMCKLDINATDSEMSSEGSVIQNQLESSEPCKKSRKGEIIEDDMRLIDCLAESTKTSRWMKTGLNVNMLATDKTSNFHLKTFLNDNFQCTESPLKENSAQSLNFALETSPNTLSEEFHDKTCRPANFTQGPLSPHQSLSVIEPSDGGEELAMQGVEPENHFEAVHLCFSVCNQAQDGAAPCPIKNDRQKRPLVTRDQQGEVPHNNNMEILIPGKRRKKNVPRKVKIKDTKASSEGSELKKMDIENDGDIKRNLDFEIYVTVDSESISHEVHSLEGYSTSQTEGATCYKAPEGQVMLDKMVGTSSTILHGTPNSHSELNVAGSESHSEHTVVGSENTNVISASRMPVARVCNGPMPGKLSAQDWPFEKQSPIWESIESMEVISKMLRQPHFRPLEQHSEGLREGLAAGLFVTYANLVNSIGDLKIYDSDKKFDDKKQIIVNLEGHGFDVQNLGARVDELLRIRSNHLQLIEKISALKLQITEEQRKENHLNSEVKCINEVIDDLKQTLSHFCERKTSILKQKEECDAEIVKLQMDERIADECYQSAEHDFESTVTAEW